MQNLSWKRFSSLGLALIAVSAVTAVFAQSSFRSAFTLNGSLTFKSDINQFVNQTANIAGEGTCTPTTHQVCHASTNDRYSATTIPPAVTSTSPTVNNTTQGGDS